MHKADKEEEQRGNAVGEKPASPGELKKLPKCGVVIKVKEAFLAKAPGGTVRGTVWESMLRGLALRTHGSSSSLQLFLREEQGLLCMVAGLAVNVTCSSSKGEDFKM